MVRLEGITQEPALVIRIAKEWRPSLSEEQLYERARRYWRIRPERRRSTPALAIVVADEAVQAVYRITGWETYDMVRETKDPDRLDQSPHPPGHRMGWTGYRASEFDSLIGIPITNPPKGQNPVAYLNC
jgi:hypothetical protein